MNKIHKTILFVNTLVIIIITTLLPIIQLIKDIVQSEKPSSKNRHLKTRHLIDILLEHVYYLF